jgi:hypothetical protein
MDANNFCGPVEDSCSICGFLNPNFEDDDLYSSYYPREFRGIAEGSGGSHMNTFCHARPQKEAQDPNPSSFNIEDVSPDWLRDELKRLFPEVRKPAPPFVYSYTGKLIAGVFGLLGIHISVEGSDKGLKNPVVSGGGQTDMYFG